MPDHIFTNSAYTRQFLSAMKKYAGAKDANTRLFYRKVMSLTTDADAWRKARLDYDYLVQDHAKNCTPDSNGDLRNEAEIGPETLAIEEILREWGVNEAALENWLAECAGGGQTPRDTLHTLFEFMSLKKSLR